MRMMIFLTKKAFFDTDYLSSFLRIDRMDLILDKYGKILISKKVKEELCDNNPYYHIKKRFQKVCEEDKVEIYEIVEDTEEWSIYRDLMFASEDVSKNVGEIASIALAKSNNSILASNNLTDVCDCVKHYNLEHTTTATELAEFCKDGTIKFKEAESYWRTMDQFNISLPKTTFENFYNSYTDPCDDFKNRKFN